MEKYTLDVRRNKLVPDKYGRWLFIGDVIGAIEEWWIEQRLVDMERCKEFEEGCIDCMIWKAYDELKQKLGIK